MRGAIGLLAAALLAPGSVPGDAHMLFRFADPRITEASGIAHGMVSPSVFYVQNDSGHSNELFAVNGRTGATVATITVRGARNVDWEDVAVAPAADGTPSIWVADIGDNDAVRRTVQIYRLAEPLLSLETRNQRLQLPVQQKWLLRYPTGPVDAESLAVALDGTAYVITKSIGSGTVYQVPRFPHPGRIQPLRELFTQDIHLRSIGNLPRLARHLLFTGAALSSDGTLFALRTYAEAWVWRLGPDGLSGRLGAPVVVPLPAQEQGEGVAIAGNHLVVDSEGAHAPVYAVPLPRELTRRPVTTSPPAVSPPVVPPGSLSPDSGAGGSDGSRWWWWAGGATLIAVGFALVRGTRRGR
jgi:hypothetical protein